MRVRCRRRTGPCRRWRSWVTRRRGPGTPGLRPQERDRAGRRGGRRCRIILYVAGGLLGPGYWLCGAVSDGHVFGKSPAEVRFTEFVLASVVVVVASWGLLLIVGEAMLFALAVFKADDRERYDVYRNLMILWGYVLTLGIPRHFRRLPAQFGALSDELRNEGAVARGVTGRATDVRAMSAVMRTYATAPAARRSGRPRGSRGVGGSVTGSRERDGSRAAASVNGRRARDEAAPARPRQRRAEDERDRRGSREVPESQEGPAPPREATRARERPAKGRRPATARGSRRAYAGTRPTRRRETSDGAPRDRTGVRRAAASRPDAPRDRARENEETRRDATPRQGGANGGAARDAARDRAGANEDVRRDAVPHGHETRDGTARETTAERTGRRQEGRGRAPSPPREEPRNGARRRENPRDRAGERQQPRPRPLPPGREDTRENAERRETPGPATPGATADGSGRCLMRACGTRRGTARVRVSDGRHAMA